MTWFLPAVPGYSAKRCLDTMRLPKTLILGFYLTLLAPYIIACPTIISNLCKCEDLHNGVQLDCSHADGAEVMQVLRENQAQVGLIQSLTLQKANIRRLPASFLAGLYIKQLDLSNNQMVDIDSNAFAGMSPVLQELILNHNNLTKIPVGALATLPTLFRLDLSNNTIGEISEDQSIPQMPKLFDVNLGSNNISNLHAGTFQKVKNTIQTINLGHNALKAVPSSAIRGLTQLQSVHLHKNKIATLDALNFLNLPVLNLLNLAGNNIQDVNRQAFLNVPNLRYLYLTGNKITKLAPHQFVTFEKMEMLDLTGNLIESLPKNCLSQLPSLRQLYLGGNNISSIEKGAFTNSSVVIMVLSDNSLTHLPESILEGLNSLQQVSFKNNKIRSIDQNAFYNAPSVVMIDLSQNMIMDLAPSTFMAQSNLLLIDLSNNKIVRTPYAAFNRRVGTVLFKENPLVCTEKVHMLQDGVGVFIPNSEDIICGGTSSTTTTSTTAAPVQMPKMFPKRPTASDSVIPSGAFQQAGLVQAPELIEEEKAEVEEQQKPQLLPTRDENGLSGRPSILNVRPKSISRPRTSFGSDIAANLPESLPAPDLGLPEEPITPIQPVEVITPETKSENPVDPPLLTPTSTLGPRVYTDIADNPNLIHPFPVPFLKRGPNLNKAIRIKATSLSPPVEEIHTLPPSIVIEPRSRPTTASPDVSQNSAESAKFEQVALLSPTSTPKQVETKTKPAAAAASGSSLTLMIVLICMAATGIIAIAACVISCIAKHRQAGRFTSSYSDSSQARTNAYVTAHQAAHMNMVYGSMGRQGTMSLPREDGQPWLYNPGPNYCNYYK